MRDMQPRVHPRISAPKLGEYLRAGGKRRTEILRDQKFPPTFKLIRYTAGTDEIRRVLLGGPDDIIPRLRASAQRLIMKPCEKAFDETCRDGSVRVIEHFTHMYSKLGMKGLECSFMGHAKLRQVIETVQVSVDPAVLLKRAVRGKANFGALLLVSGKTHPMQEDSGHAVAALLCETLGQIGLPGPVNPDLCLVVDVFRETSFRAPKHRLKLMKEIGWNCLEIAERWPSIGTRAA